MKKWLKWRREGKPMIRYEGFWCIVCNTWQAEPFGIKAYKTKGKFMDQNLRLCKIHKKEKRGHVYFG